MEDRPALSYIVPSECVTECVQGSCRWFEAESGAETFDITKSNIPAHLRPEFAGQKKFVRLLVVFADKPKDLTTKFEREGNDRLLVALTSQREKQVVEVDVYHINHEALPNPATCVQQNENQQMQTPFVRSFRFPRHQQLDLSGSETSAGRWTVL